MSPPRIKYLVALKVFEPEPPLQNKTTGIFFFSQINSFVYIMATFFFSSACVGYGCVGALQYLLSYENLTRGMRGGARCVTIQ